MLAAYKGALSQSIRQYLESTFMHLYNDATKENIEQLKNAVQNRYGGWNDVKGQQNYDSMMAIPNFVDVDSVDKGLFELQRLMTEREEHSHIGGLQALAERKRRAKRRKNARL